MNISKCRNTNVLLIFIFIISMVFSACDNGDVQNDVSGTQSNADIVEIVQELEPGAVFREYLFLNLNSKGNPSNFYPQLEGMSDDRPMYKGTKDPTPRFLEIDDLEGAIRAELVPEFWGGHNGTANKQFKVNDSEWIKLPLPKGTESKPELYTYTVLGSPVEIPIENLINGENEFHFFGGPQYEEANFNWPYYFIYSFRVRVYYDPSKKEHPQGEIILPAEGGVIGDMAEIEVSLGESPNSIKRVDFVGYYEDYDWKGIGDYTDWHFNYRYGTLNSKIGTAEEAPYKVEWDNTWVPDQELKLSAFVTDETDLTYMLPAVDVELRHSDRIVKMYPSGEVPEHFVARSKHKLESRLPIDDDLLKAKSAKLFIFSWSGDFNEEIFFNGIPIQTEKIGRHHYYSYDSVDVPLEIIRSTREGINIFRPYATTAHHGMEVLWPGPALYIAYER